ELAAAVAALRRDTEHPKAESWGEFKSLLDLLATAPDPQATRLRLRAELRRVIDSIHLVVVAKGWHRVAVAQAYFAGGGHREFVIVHRRGEAPGESWVASAARAGLPEFNFATAAPGRVEEVAAQALAFLDQPLLPVLEPEGGLVWPMEPE